MVIAYFIGTAGSGKSTLTKVVREYLLYQEENVITVNLDPGVKHLPYYPDIDVRDLVDVETVMREHDLGPNGALVLACDMIADKVDVLKKDVEEARAKYVLVDTPGQLELFALRDSGPAIVRAFGRERSICFFLIDAVPAKNPINLLTQLYLGMISACRLGIPVRNLLTKVDLLSQDELDKILNATRDAYLLYDELDLIEDVELTDIFQRLAQGLEGFSGNEPIPVSSVSMSGIHSVYEVMGRLELDQ